MASITQDGSDIAPEQSINEHDPAVSRRADESDKQDPLSSPTTIENLEKCLQEADELKREGNDSFRAQKWEEALATYRRALGRLPKRPAIQNASLPNKGKNREVIEDDGGLTKNATPEDSSLKAEQAAEPEPSETEQRCRKARSVLYANVAACYVKLGEHKEVVTACTEALHDDPRYVKVLQRRAASNEQLGTWSSLSSAQEDYNKLLELLPPGAQATETRRLLDALRPRLEAAQKQETDEMLGKLKGLGNSILGNFGLSTDNFQFIPNGQGGYSMNFVR